MCTWQAVVCSHGSWLKRSDSASCPPGGKKMCDEWASHTCDLQAHLGSRLRPMQCCRPKLSRRMNVTASGNWGCALSSLKWRLVGRRRLGALLAGLVRAPERRRFANSAPRWAEFGRSRPQALVNNQLELAKLGPGSTPVWQVELVPHHVWHAFDQLGMMPILLGRVQLKFGRRRPGLAQNSPSSSWNVPNCSVRCQPSRARSVREDFD